MSSRGIDGGRPSRVVVAGCGGIAPAWLGAARTREDVAIVAMADPLQDRAEALASRFDLACPLFTSLEAALAAQEADLVFNLTAPAAHHEVTLTALAAGCHVFSEKPLAASMEEAIELAEAAERAGRALSVMQNRRYSPSIRSMRDALRSGVIGTPGLYAVDFFLGPHFGGFREAMASPLVLDMAIHNFDCARFLAGARPVAAHCIEFNPPGSWYAGAAAALCAFEMSDGSVVSYRGSWAAVGFPTSWEGSWRITGSAGTAVLDGSEPRYQVAASGEGFIHPVRDVTAPSTWEGREGHAGCLDEMLAALAAGRPAETSAADNLLTIAMVFGALASSARGGSRVEIGQDGRLLL